jgi:hypothetical protein
MNIEIKISKDSLEMPRRVGSYHDIDKAIDYLQEYKQRMKEQEEREENELCKY